MLRLRLLSTFASAGLLLLAACGGPEPDDGQNGGPPPGSGLDEDGRVADFSLEDVNPTSLTFGQPVSPRDYLEKVAGIFFVHST